MKKLLVAFRNFANAPKKRCHGSKYYNTIYWECNCIFIWLTKNWKKDEKWKFVPVFTYLHTNPLMHIKGRRIYFQALTSALYGGGRLASHYVCFRLTVRVPAFNKVDRKLDGSWHLVPELAGSNPTEAVGFFKIRRSHVVDWRHVKDPWMLRAFSGKIHL
jgi:hypothetical protein